MLEKFFFKYRGVAAGLPLIFAMWSPLFRAKDMTFAWSAGIILVFTGFLLRCWAEEHLGYRLGRPMSLTVTGPYSIIRNPLYAGNILLITGATFASGLIWFVPFSFCWAILCLDYVARFEEKKLVAEYGEAGKLYIESVPRWIPRNIRVAFSSSWNKNDIFKILFSEIHCFLILIPFVIKDIALK